METILPLFICVKARLPSKMLSVKSRVTIFSVLIVLTFSTFVPALAYAAPLSESAKDWVNINGNSWAQNYSPETSITKDNVNNLEVKWLFALEGVTTAGPKLFASLNPTDGASHPPLVKNGVVYVMTNFLKLYAIDAKTGKQIWANSYDVNITDAVERLPLRTASFSSEHIHGVSFWEGGNLILNRGVACDFYGVDANTGKTTLWIKDLCEDVPGNLYQYHTMYTGAKSGTIGTYEKGRQFIYVMSGGMHSSYYLGDGRHVVMGISMDAPHEILWRVFGYPPQDVPTKDWDLQDCSIGFFGDTPCSEVAANAPQNLEWDWSQPGEAPNIYGGVTASWGQLVVDEDTGIVYIPTGNQGPYGYVGTTPGPRLYGSTIMAIDMNQGKRVWWLQPFQRDLYDYDCNWSGILANDPTLGKVYIKGCKEGVLNVMDAATGKPYYRTDVILEQVDWGQIGPQALLPPEQGGVHYHVNDVFDTYTMRDLTGIDNSQFCGAPCVVYPGWTNGLFGTDMSYDPKTGTLFHYANALETSILKSNPPPESGVGSAFSTKSYPDTNSTLVARDLATGQVKWTYYYDYSVQRSMITVTPTMVFAGYTDGYLRFFDKNDGTLLREMNLGSTMTAGFTTGQDSDGNQEIFGIIGTGSVSQARVYPTTSAAGVVVGIGLAERSASTMTTTAVSTITSTTVATTTVTTISAVTSVSTTTATTAMTVVSTQPAKTTTVTSEITETSGLPAEVTYAAVAVAVIAIIAATVLVMRKK
jgi:alcohol dehydrogenase (cytochrome c)